jgi:hypothetical protein
MPPPPPIIPPIPPPPCGGAAFLVGGAELAQGSRSDSIFAAASLKPFLFDLGPLAGGFGGLHPRP